MELIDPSEAQRDMHPEDHVRSIRSPDSSDYCSIEPWILRKLICLNAPARHILFKGQ
jgi:hypothetical protein